MPWPVGTQLLQMAGSVDEVQLKPRRVGPETRSAVMGGRGAGPKLARENQLSSLQEFCKRVLNIAIF